MAGALDILCDGRLEFGTGRSSTRAELEGFGIDPLDTRDLWEEALDVVVGRVDERRLRVAGHATSRSRRAACTRSRSRSRIRRCGCVDQQPGQPRGRRAQGARPALVHHRRAARGAGGRIELYRDGLTEAKPVGQVRQLARRHLHHGALRRDQRGGAAERRAESVVWYFRKSIELIGSARHLAGGGQRARHATTTAETLQRPRISQASASTCSTRWARSSSATRRAASRRVRRYRDAGCDQLLCLMQPVQHPADKVMRSIELFGEHVIPAFREAAG